MNNTGAVIAVTAALWLSACAQGGDGSEITTGSILPAMPTLPSAASLTALLPSSGADARLRAPERVSGNLYRVSSADRRLDDMVQRQNYALLRAAEGTRQLGGTHFVVVNGSDAADPANPSALIRVMKLDQGVELPLGAVSADEIIHFFGPTFGRSDQAIPTAPASPAAGRS